MRVRSPLFQGEITANLKLGGTLKEPTAIGDMRIESGIVRFPFANLEVQQGIVSLTPQNPYEPELSINAASKQYGYDIRMDVSGRASAPLLQFSSSPRFCVTCHYMRPFYASWQKSAHNQVKCIDCHFPPGLNFELERKFQALVQVVKYVTRQYGTRPWTQVEDSSCMRPGCHETRLLSGRVEYRGVRFGYRTGPEILHGIESPLPPITGFVMTSPKENRLVEIPLQAYFRVNAERLWRGLEALGLELHVPPAYRIPSLTTVRVPDGVDEAAVRTRLREEYGIEIGSGLGPLKGKIWRIGLMGESSTEAHVLTLLNALEALFMRGGWLQTPGVALQAASRIYSHVPCRPEVERS